MKKRYKLRAIASRSKTKNSNHLRVNYICSVIKSQEPSGESANPNHWGQDAFVLIIHDRDASTKTQNYVIYKTYVKIN